MTTKGRSSGPHEDPFDSGAGLAIPVAFLVAAIGLGIFWLLFSLGGQ